MSSRNPQRPAIRKATASDFVGRFREVVADPLNLLIERVPEAGMVEGDLVVLHNGNRVPLRGQGAYYEGFSDILAINRGVHEPLEEYAFQELLRILPRKPLMLELGAYWAHYSLWLKKARPEATVICVEPDPQSLAAGRANFELNGAEGEFIAAAVRTGEFEIDQFLAKRRIKRLDILHADIQGFEGQMVKGAQKALSAKRIDYLFISTHSDRWHYRIVGALTKHGYRIEVSSDVDHETSSLDGLIFASSPLREPVFRSFLNVGREQILRMSPRDHLARLTKMAPSGGASDAS